MTHRRTERPGPTGLPGAEEPEGPPPSRGADHDVPSPIEPRRATGLPGSRAAANPLDRHGRPLSNLRLSVTDRCNLRCAYCMPEEEYVWLPKAKLLTFEEIGRLVDAFVELGVRRVRLTGGEPLLRRELPTLVAELRRRPRLEDIALTTNGLKLAEHATALREAGLDRVTVSLDSLRPKRYRELTRREGLDQALAGLRAARAAGYPSIKLNAVVLRGSNDDELAELLAFGRDEGVEVRFVEYMDVGGATRWSREDVVSRREILERLARVFGTLERESTPEDQGSAPAVRYRLADGTRFGIIASTTEPFCGSCDRSRLTADGQWFTCLYARKGRDLRTPLRDGASLEELVDLLASAWRTRSDRGAEERLANPERRVLAPVEELQRDPHLEMHTRGG